MSNYHTYLPKNGIISFLIPKKRLLQRINMHINDLVSEYKKISEFLNTRWPLKNNEQKVFARTMKIMEELGELSDEILTSMNLQRNTKVANFSRENVEDEFADVLGSLILLGIELDIDVEKVMKKKIAFTRDRFEMEAE
jgi:NTP pyrophosphatase (non-canonical NTP hydrolase)